MGYKGAFSTRSPDVGLRGVVPRESHMNPYILWVKCDHIW